MVTTEERITPQEIIARYQDKSKGWGWKSYAYEALSQFCYRQGFTFEEASQLIRAAAEMDFPETPYKGEEIPYKLIVHIAESPSLLNDTSRYLELIKEVFPRFKPPAQAAAIQLLARLPEREGAVRVMEIVNGYDEKVDAERIRDAISAIWMGTSRNKQHADVYFPDLLKFISVDDSGLVYRLYYDFCRHQTIDETTKNKSISILLNDYRVLKTQIIGYDENTSVRWSHNWWEHQAACHRAGLLLDILGYHVHQKVINELCEALTLYSQPLLVGWAIIALLRLGQGVPLESVYKAAADDEIRKPFYESLRELGRTEIYPDEYRTKEAFARSDMINWLTHPNELGTMPDEIELMAVVAQQYGDPPMWEDWYVFRFRSEIHYKDVGWMAGWSGPFPRDAAPGDILTPGGTFSHFQQWDSKTPEQHVARNPLDAAETDGCLVIWKKEKPDETNS